MSLWANERLVSKGGAGEGSDGGGGTSGGAAGGEDGGRGGSWRRHGAWVVDTAASLRHDSLAAAQHIGLKLSPL